MKTTMLGIAAIAVVALGAAPVVAQTGGTVKKGEEQISVTGCVQREADYRKAQDKGRGGALGTGVGVENEYVLTNMTMSGADAKKSGIETTTAYELTGENEKLAGPHLGHRVEIAGILKAAEVSAAGATGGATAGTPPSGVDVVSKDLQLRELEVTTVKMLAPLCVRRLPAAISGIVHPRSSSSEGQRRVAR